MNPKNETKQVECLGHLVTNSGGFYACDITPAFTTLCFYCFTGLLYTWQVMLTFGILEHGQMTHSTRNPQ